MSTKPTELESAAVLARIVAQCIDLAVALFIISLFSALPTPDGAIRVIVGLIGLALGLSYRLLGDGLFGGHAIGKRILGIRVVDAATRQPCSLGQCAIRIGVTFIPLVIFIEIVLLAIDGQERWGDRVARTYVLRVHPKPAPVQQQLRPINLSGLKDTLNRINPNDRNA